MATPPRTWKFAPPPDPKSVARLQGELGISPLLARLLAQRGLAAPEEAARFLKPSLAHFHDPFLLAGMDKAATRLARAVRNGEPITVFGDYDVDGVSSTALLVNFLGAVGARVDSYIPHRMKEGYGLSMEGIEKALSQGTKVIVTVDNGVAHPEEVARAQAGGIDVIVTDHHRIPEGGNPAFAIVNPHQEGCAYPFKILAGAGIALNVALGLRQRLREEGHFAPKPEPNLREFLDLAALGTVADVVPLRDTNRVIVSFGVEQTLKSRWPGLRALFAVAGLHPEAFSSEDIAFQIAPRINAGGRLADAAAAVELLTTQNPSRARELAQVLDAHNQERRDLERAMVEEAVKKIEKDNLLEGRKSIVLWQEGWHPGVVGIVAARLVDRYHRPAIVAGIVGGKAKASARSAGGYNIYEGIKSASRHLEAFGGHAQAAGFSAKPENLPAFALALEANAGEWIKPGQLDPYLSIDSELPAEELSWQAADEIERLAPFGMGNPRPILALRGVRMREPRLLKDAHLKALVSAAEGPLDAIGFSLAGSPGAAEALRGGPLDVAGWFEWNLWQGRKRLQLRIKDLRLPQ